MLTRSCQVLLILALVLPARGYAQGPERPSLLLPPLQRCLTRVEGTFRPFLVTGGPGGFGMLSDLSLEHYFRVPLKLGVTLRPVALLAERDATGFIGHVRGEVAFAGDYIEVGGAAGVQVQHFGLSGGALAATLRLGSLDGINLLFENGYALIKGYYSGDTRLALDHFLGQVNVPVTRRLTLNLSGGFGLDLWGYATLGLKHYLRGQGGRGTVILGGALGAVVVVDRFPCQYQDPSPCQGASKGFGPTIAFSAERRW